jgi:hypothetical protein
MHMILRSVVALLLVVWLSASVQAEVLIRWDLEQIPSPESLGISAVVMPAASTAAVRRAVTQGYRVFLEVEASKLAGVALAAEGVTGVVVKGNVSAAQLRALKLRIKSPVFRVLVAEEGGKWPHIRTNWVTTNKDVLQVSGRSAQPWLDNNLALLRILLARSESRPLLTYRWEPTTLSEVDEGPALEDYLVAIAEAGSFGGDLLLPLHQRFEQNLLLGQPNARAWWSEIQRALTFYSWDLPGRYRPVANIGIVTAHPMLWLDVMNLLGRHNLPFELLDPARLAGDLAAFDLLLMMDQPTAREVDRLSAFARKGAAVVAVGGAAGPWRTEPPDVKTEERVSYQFGEGRVIEWLKTIADPNTFALEIRQILGRDRRVIDIWNGITVLTVSYQEAGGANLLVTALNYAHQPLPVQLRVKGTFSQVHYESPEEPASLVSHQHREGYTEFVLPALRVGGRVFLSRTP